MLTSYEFVSAWLQARCKTDRGASLVEYALLVALIAVVCIGAVAFLGRNSSSSLNKSAANADQPGGPTTTAPGGCPAVHPDGYATGPGYGWDCYSPTYGPYNV